MFSTPAAKLLIYGCFLSAKDNFIHSIKNQEYLAVTGVTGYTALNDSPASDTKKIPQKKLASTAFAKKRRVVQPKMFAIGGPRCLVKLLKTFPSYSPTK